MARIYSPRLHLLRRNRSVCALCNCLIVDQDAWWDVPEFYWSGSLPVRYHLECDTCFVLEFANAEYRCYARRHTYESEQIYDDALTLIASRVEFAHERIDDILFPGERFTRFTAAAGDTLSVDGTPIPGFVSAELRHSRFVTVPAKDSHDDEALKTDPIELLRVSRAKTTDLRERLDR